MSSKVTCSNPDTHRGAEQRSGTDAQNPPELLLFGAWWFTEVEHRADPSIPNKANPAQFEREKGQKQADDRYCVYGRVCVQSIKSALGEQQSAQSRFVEL